MRLSILVLAGLGALSLAACSRKPPTTETGDTNVTGDDTDTTGGDDTDTNDTDTNDTGDTGNGGSCGVPDDYGSWWGKLDPSAVTGTAYTNDAGIAALYAADPGDGNTATVDVTITDAYVTNTGYVPSGSNIDTFWIGDQNGAVHAYMVDSGTQDLAPGTKISMHVTEISNYHGGLEITAADAVALGETGGEAYVIDASSTDLDYASMSQNNVYTYGEITSDDGACGGSSECYTLKTPSGQSVNFRVKASKGVVVGDCVEVTTPLGWFDGDHQLDVGDLDMMAWY